ncbi:MAG: bifunctional metallophosphatase/5'-nucleotidase, partial [Candidatus Acidiferrales bacterium]
RGALLVLRRKLSLQARPRLGGRKSQAPLRAACLLLLLAALALVAPAQAASSDPGERVTITVVGTTDIHGNVWPYDYLTARPVERGLAKVATYVKQVRARQPNLLVVDSGDTFQGTPLAYVAGVKHPREPNPTVAAMNAIGYDAMACGNHEFNYGLHTLWRWKEQARFPILAANVTSPYHDDVRAFEPYVIRRVGGVRVALLGMVTPAVPNWEPPENIAAYKFRGLVETARKYVPQLRRKADVVIVLVHSGLGRDEQTGAPLTGELPGEDAAWAIAEEVSGIDAVFFGHSHRELAGREVNGALLVQAKNWAQSVAEVDFTLERAGERWRVVERASRLVPMDASIPADPEILELTRAAHERTETWLNTVVAQLDADLDARTARLEDHPLVELIQRAQLAATGADVSLAALFSTATRWRAGPVTVRDIYSLYFYDNQLFTVEITGKQLKEALEQSARYFAGFPWPESDSPFGEVRGYNFDMAEGVTYKLDLARLAGERVVDLSWRGAPLAPDQKLKLALNSYRWAGGGGFSMLRRAKALSRAHSSVRELLIEYLLQQGSVPTAADANWEIVPAEAAEALRQSVLSPAP